MEELCIHELPSGQCSYCKPDRGYGSDPVRIFRAKYEGHCSGCNLPISIGQMVAWTPGRPTIHEGCS